MTNDKSQTSRLKKIRKYLRDHHLTIIAIFVAIIIAILGVWIRNYNQRSELSYQIIDISPLINQKDIGENSDNWELRHDNELVNNPFSVIYLIKNTGKITIGKNDFGSNIKINMGEDNKILSSFLSETNPPLIKEMIERNNGIVINPSESNQSIEIKPHIFNSGDSLTLKVIVDNFNRDTIGYPDARIEGINKIKQIIPTTKPSTKLSIPLLLILLISFYLGIVAFFKSKNKSLLIFLSIVIFLLGIIELFEVLSF